MLHKVNVFYSKNYFMFYVKYDTCYKNGELNGFETGSLLTTTFSQCFASITGTCIMILNICHGLSINYIS